jgi:molybdopterin-guanine dinucleotide biosynthesis protein A
MGGVDKTALELAGRSLRDRALDAVAGAERVVLVGPAAGAVGGRGAAVAVGPQVPAATGGRVIAVREEPPGGGPLAAVEAALPHVVTGVVVVLAADLPFPAGLPEAVVGVLDRADTADDVDCAVPVDDGGHRQPLAAAYRAVALRDAVAGARPTAGRPFRDVLTGLRVVDVPAAALPPDALLDVDTPQDWDTALWTQRRGAVRAVDSAFRRAGPP